MLLMGVSPEQTERYLYHDCLLLAMAISSLTDWPIVQIFDGDTADPDVRHALVQMPDGRLLDVAGVHGDYRGEVPLCPEDWDMTEGEVRDWIDYVGEHHMPDVTADAEQLLLELNLHP